MGHRVCITQFFAHSPSARDWKAPDPFLPECSASTDLQHTKQLPATEGRVLEEFQEQQCLGEFGELREEGRISAGDPHALPEHIMSWLSFVSQQQPSL